MTYTDSAKGFNRCDHGIIAHKICEMGVTGKGGRCTYKFLTNISQNVIRQFAMPP